MHRFTFSFPFHLLGTTGFLFEPGMLFFRVNSTEPVPSIDTPWDLALAHPEVVRCYYRDIDATLIRENLKLTPAERLQKLEEVVSFVTSLRRAERRSKALGRDA